MAEDPQGNSLAAFVTPLTISAHDREYSPEPKWQETTKSYNKDGDLTDAECKFLAACNQRFPNHYTNGVKVEPGKIMAAFASKKVWAGHGGLQGYRDRTLSSMETGKASTHTYINHRLPNNSRLSGVAKSMAEASVSWTCYVHAFFDKDFTELVDLGLTVDQTFELLSEYVVIMFDLFYTHQQLLLHFTSNMVKADFVVRLIWVNLLIHKEMERLIANGNMKQNSSLASAFIRLLTKASASTNTTSVLTRVAAIEKQLKDTDLKKLKDDVGGAKSKADTFSATVEGMRTNLRNAKKK